MFYLNPRRTERGFSRKSAVCLRFLGKIIFTKKLPNIFQMVNIYFCLQFLAPGLQKSAKTLIFGAFFLTPKNTTKIAVFVQFFKNWGHRIQFKVHTHHLEDIWQLFR